MKTDSDLDRQVRRLLREGLNLEVGPDPTWAESPASRRVAEQERRARLRWPLRILAVAALLGAIGGAALLGGAPPASRLAYELDDHIYVADSDGQNPVRISDGEDGKCSSFGGEGSMWSPDGRHLAFRGCDSVFIADAAGHLVASFPGTGWRISWSPDSTRVATWVELFETVGIYGINGDRQALLSAPRGCVSGDHDPLWSPDGQSVGTDMCEMPIDGQPPRFHVFDYYRQWWAYSPDRTRVAYATGTELGNLRTVSLVVADADGTELQRLTYQHDWSDRTGEVGYFTNIVWSPLGDRVAYAWVTQTIDLSPLASELRVLDISSGDETTIAAELGIGGPLAFSPEGDRILFSRRALDEETGRDLEGEGMGLWSISVDGSDAQLLVPGAHWGDWQPPGS